MKGHFFLRRRSTHANGFLYDFWFRDRHHHGIVAYVAPATCFQPGFQRGNERFELFELIELFELFELFELSTVAHTSTR